MGCEDNCQLACEIRLLPTSSVSQARHLLIKDKANIAVSSAVLLNAANEIRHKKNVDIRWPKGYTDVAKQVNNRTAGEDGCKVCVFIFDKNACSCFAYFAAICPVRKTCLAAGAMRFLCAASAAHFLFSGACVYHLSLFYGLYRTVQKLYNQFMKIRLAREAADRRQRKTEEEKT